MRTIHSFHQPSYLDVGYWRYFILRWLHFVFFTEAKVILIRAMRIYTCMCCAFDKVSQSFETVPEVWGSLRIWHEATCIGNPLRNNLMNHWPSSTRYGSTLPYPVILPARLKYDDCIISREVQRSKNVTHPVNTCKHGHKSGNVYLWVSTIKPNCVYLFLLF